jgi:ribosomal-protein-alanine N-acetyltransferase
MPILIRLLCEEDIEQAIEIENEAFSTMLPPTNYERELKNDLAFYIVAYDDQQVIDIIDKERELGGRYPIIGMAGFWLMAGEAHIVNIAVRQAYRRRGIGELLLIKLINLALEKGANIITLEVRKTNIEAQKLYNTYGFKPQGIRLGYYMDDREDAVIMTTDDIRSDTFQTNLLSRKRALPIME